VAGRRVAPGGKGDAAMKGLVLVIEGIIPSRAEQLCRRLEQEGYSVLLSSGTESDWLRLTRCSAVVLIAPNVNHGWFHFGAAMALGKQVWCWNPDRANHDGMDVTTIHDIEKLIAEIKGESY